MDEKNKQFEDELKTKSSVEKIKVKVKLIEELDKTKSQVEKLDVAKKKDLVTLSKIMEKMKELSERILITDKLIEE